MTATPLSRTTSYCTAAEFVVRVDVRVVGMWLSDTGTQLTESEVLASTVLATLLKEASGELESACLVGERYVPDDLAALLTAANVSAEFLKGIVAGITFGKVWGHRPRTAAEPYPPMAQWAEGKLEALSMGKRIFGFQEAAEAGRMDISQESVADIEARNGVVFQAARFFGRRANREYPQG